VLGHVGAGGPQGREDMEDVENVPRWSDFTKKNGRDLEAWGEKLIESKMASGALVSKASFLDVLEQEVESLRSLMVAQRSEIEARARDTVKNPSPSSVVTIQSKSGDDLTSLFTSLIDAALLRYSKDTIAKPDYALFTAGGRVVPSITSDTLVMRSSSRWSKLVWGKRDFEGIPPAHALLPDLGVGSCWPFSGGKGQLGVMLTRRVVVSDITVDHAPKDLAMNVTSAPRAVEVVRILPFDGCAELTTQWGLVDGVENRAKVREYLSKAPEYEYVYLHTSSCTRSCAVSDFWTTN
jgi:SUN domain-containing protein 1/2